MGKQKHLLMKNKKYICLCWMKKIFKCRRQTSSSFASDQSWDDFIPRFYQILIQSHPPRNIFTSWNILFVLQNINVWLKIYFYQISPLLMQQCVAATLWHTALCAECDANLIRNSEEICFQRHFSRAAPTLEKARLQVLRQSQLFPHPSYWEQKSKRFFPWFLSPLLPAADVETLVVLQLQNFLFQSLLSVQPQLFATFFARICIDPVTS